jgi:arylsulfatase A-like enzyme
LISVVGAKRLLPVALIAALSGCTKSRQAEPPQHLSKGPFIIHSNAWDTEVTCPVAFEEDSRPCFAAPTPSETRVQVELPSHPELTFAIGIKMLTPHSEELQPKSRAPEQVSHKARFVIRAGENEPLDEVFRRDVHLARNNQWLEQSVDLGSYAGRTIWLSFQTSRGGLSTDPREESTNFVALFADPVIHERDVARRGRVVVLISIDTLRRDHLSLYGYRRRTTPGLDHLAADSVVFDDAISTSSWTLPAHASLLTSLQPSVHGGVAVDLRIRDGLLTLAEFLQRRGFYTQAIVTQIYLSEKFGLRKGFDAMHWMQEAKARVVTDRAIRFLQSKHDDDFLLFLHYFDPHFNYEPPPPYDRFFDPDYSGPAVGTYSIFSGETADSIDRRDLEHIVALYDGEILYTDFQIQRLFQEMKRLGIYDNALIIVTSDHGEEFLEHGFWGHSEKLYEELIRVPLLMKLPGGEARGSRLTRQVSLLDVAPTIVDVLGLSVPGSFQGESLLSPADDENSPAWSEVGTNARSYSVHKVSLRRGARGRKFIFEDKPSDDLSIEVYDLARDPAEAKNLGMVDSGTLEVAQRQLAAFLSLMAARAGNTSPSTPPELTAEHLEQLRALGYAR